jgi:hypothetical protein
MSHLLVLAEVQCARGPQIADAECGQPGSPVYDQFFRTPIVEVQQDMMLQPLDLALRPLDPAS